MVKSLICHLDSLTGIFNRYSYENDLKALETDFSEKDITLVAMDVNRLKYVNDHMGHPVGDELLKAAGGCIEKAFGELGKCYRIGGDEFAVIIENSKISEEELVEKLQANTASWHGDSLQELTISVGVVNSRKDQVSDIKDLTSKADEKMYKSKYEFYEESGYDRRLNNIE